MRKTPFSTAPPISRDEKGIFVLGIIVFLLLFVAGCTTVSGLERDLDLLRKNDAPLEERLALIDLILESGEPHPDLVLEAGAYHWALGEDEKARGRFEEGIPLGGPAAGAVSYFFGRLAYVAGELKQAEHFARNATREEPDNPFYCHLLGSTLFKQNRFAEAASVLAKGARSRTDKGAIHLALSEAAIISFVRDGNFEDALDHWTDFKTRKAEKGSPLCDEQRFLGATAAFGSGRMMEAQDLASSINNSSLAEIFFQNTKLER